MFFKQYLLVSLCLEMVGHWVWGGEEHIGPDTARYGAKVQTSFKNINIEIPENDRN